ncbi:hypothetical protein GIB67_022439 [Kingdonia uniflora]|uniref:PPM-type phosphatase domain-containing protein n=1 Tax=Kingdonia uniflora TaxID=39325 RepID=A0A7J7MTW2_9MAGN|nr:hypothetical protein GIB67_022439 [Kingdonia uniflora]
MERDDKSMEAVLGTSILTMEHSHYYRAHAKLWGTYTLNPRDITYKGVIPRSLHCLQCALKKRYSVPLVAVTKENEIKINCHGALNGNPGVAGVGVGAVARNFKTGCFQRTDEFLLQESAAGAWHDGATAVCIWVLGQKVFVANIGDSKAVVARSCTSDATEKHLEGASPLKAIVLTREHKVIYPQERTRIVKAGGSVSLNGRLQGRLEVSRAFGDRQFKKVGVIATPDVHSFDLTEREHFIILGCDGLWGVFGTSDAVDFVQKQFKEGLSVTAASRRLVREAVRERRCKDNCTAIIIVFKHK